MFELLAPIIGSAVGGLLGGGDQQQQQTATKEPWAEAAPWLKQNIQTGQDLQGFYQRSPFNALQQGAYRNLSLQNDHFNSIVPGLLSQFGQQNGFDRNNPRARPAPISVNAPPPMWGMAGLLDPNTRDMNQGFNPFSNGGVQAPAPAPAAPAIDPRMQAMYDDWYNRQNSRAGEGP